MSEGPMDGCWKGHLWRVSSFVLPAMAMYSPPEREVGIQMMRMEAGVRENGSATLVLERMAIPSKLTVLFAAAYGRKMGG